MSAYHAAARRLAAVAAARLGPPCVTLVARCPACDRRMQVTTDRIDGRLRRHRGPDGAPCRCRALVRDAVAVEALRLVDLAALYRQRARALRAQPCDLRRVLRWDDCAAVAEHAAVRLRAWVEGGR